MSQNGTSTPSEEQECIYCDELLCARCTLYMLRDGPPRHINGFNQEH